MDLADRVREVSSRIAKRIDSVKTEEATNGRCRHEEAREGRLRHHGEQLANRRRDRATETADPKEAGRLADTTPGAHRRRRRPRGPGRPGRAAGVAAWYSAFDGDPSPPRPDGQPPPGCGPPRPRARTAPCRSDRPMTGPAAVAVARIDAEFARRFRGRVQRLVASDGPGNLRGDPAVQSRLATRAKERRGFVPTTTGAIHCAAWPRQTTIHGVGARRNERESSFHSEYDAESRPSTP